MSVQNEIDRINNNIANTYATLNEAGATMPAAANSNNLSATAASISAVLFNKAQNLTAAQQQQARDNIGVEAVEGPQGPRGTGILKITTAPSSYTTATGGFTPTYRISLSTVKTQSKVSSVIVGDVLQYNYYQYPVGYVDSSYVYTGASTSIRGASGSPGADGNGILSVVQTTTSNADGGSNILTITEDDGTTSTFTVRNGSKGSTPVKGTDYYTPADQESIVQQVIAALGTPVFGRVDENNNIILSGDLASGTYTVKYEDSEGNTTDIGSLNAVAGSFEILPVWTEDRMIQASLSAWNLGESFTADAYAVTERISIDDGYSYTVSAEGWTAGNSCYAYWYNANGGFIAGGSISSGEGWSTSDSGDVSFTLNPPVGTRMFRLQSYCGSDFSQLSKVVVTANLDSTKKYGDSILITWQNGVKLSKTDGSVQSTGDEAYSASDFIQLDKTKTYTLYLVCDSSVSTAGNIVYYDASGNFVSYIAEPVKSTNSAFSYTLSIPENATQMRLRMYDYTHSYAFIDQYYILVT